VNIVILVSGLPPERIGGAERQAAYLAEQLARQHHVRLLTRTATVPANLQGLERCVVVKRCRLDAPAVRFVADIAETLIAIGRSRDTVDVIIAYQTVIDGLIGVLAKLLFGTPVIVSIRCDTEYQLDRYPQSRLFSPFVFQHADRLAVQSTRIGRELVDAFAARRRPTARALHDKMFVLPNALPAETIRPADGEYVLYVGRLTKPKSVSVLLEAMRQCPNDRLVVVGDGPDREALVASARGLPNISFAGKVDHAAVKQYLQCAKMLVLPSRQEGQPNAVMEAMAAGVPVIATRVGGLPDLIEHGQSGWLVEPGNVPALAEAIQALSADAGLRARLAEHARRVVRQYDWPSTMAILERELEQLRRMKAGDNHQFREEEV
jgi:glycogen(starch) synthase